MDPSKEWLSPIQYNDDPLVPNAEPEIPGYVPPPMDGTIVHIRSPEARDAGRPDPALADQTPVNYGRGPHRDVIDIDDQDAA